MLKLNQARPAAVESPVAVAPGRPAAPKPASSFQQRLELFMAGSISPQVISQMLHSFALMIRSGVPLSRTMDILAQQETHPGFKRVLVHMARLVQQHGASVAQAMKQFPEVFSPATQLLIKAGDMSGQLDGRAEQAARLLERQTKLTNDVKAATTQPMLTAGACIVMTWGVVRFVLPRFLEMYQGLKMDLPLVTKMVVAVVSVVNNPMTTIAFLGTVGAAIWHRHKVFDYFTRIAFNFPFIRRIIGQTLATSFCDILGRLYADGVAISTSLEMLASSTRIGEYQRALEKATVRFKSDGQLSAAISHINFFPAAVTQMIKVGEESGQLDRMLLTLHDLLDEANQDLLHRAVVTLEPIMMAVVGAILSFLAIGLFLPIYNMLSHLGT
ncbi:MAG TPA: type II secretion system F family protein [Candidatus Xenobia bacterium]|jgi:type IV pilus assembly protein PilC